MRVVSAENPAQHGSDDPVKRRDRLDDDVVVDRPEDEDHDLLTFGEAGARLEEEVEKQRRTVERLREGGAEQSVLDRAQRRLETLQHARERNSPPSLDGLRSSGFFGPRR